VLSSYPEGPIDGTSARPCKPPPNELNAGFEVELKLFQGRVLPTNLVTERNGAIWSSTQMVNVELNVPIR
jgi:hypothetical protein